MNEKQSTSGLSYGKSSSDNTLDESKLVKATIQQYDAVLQGKKYTDVALNKTAPTAGRDPVDAQGAL